MYAGNHYYLNTQVDSKSKKSATVDQQGYSLIFYIIAELKKVLLVKFVSGDREKFGIIYGIGESLMISTLIHNNYQRATPDNERLPLPKAKEHAEKMLSKFSIRRFDPSSTDDKYEDSIKKYIEDLKLVAKGGKIKATFKHKSPVCYDQDFFSQLDSII